MIDVEIIQVPHLGGIEASYKLSHPYDPQKPTVVLIAPFSMPLDIFSSQFEDDALKDAVNVLAIDPLGQGRTQTLKTDEWNYWDTARMNLQVLEGLHVEKAFSMGSSQGGWIAVQMALLEPDKNNRCQIIGIIPIGTHMDCERDQPRSPNCWDAVPIMTPIIEGLTSPDPTPDFVLESQFCDTAFESYTGRKVGRTQAEFWYSRYRERYSGDEGRRKLRTLSICLRDRESLHGRLAEIRCPVFWIHGTEDLLYSIEQVKSEIGMFSNSPDAQLKLIPDGKTMLHWTHPGVVNKAVADFVRACCK